MCGFRSPARDPGCAAAERGPAEAGQAGPPAPGPQPARLPLSGRWPDGKGLRQGTRVRQAARQRPPPPTLRPTPSQPAAC